MKQKKRGYRGGRRGLRVQGPSGMRKKRREKNQKQMLFENAIMKHNTADTNLDKLALFKGYIDLF